MKQPRRWPGIFWNIILRDDEDKYIGLVTGKLCCHVTIDLVKYFKYNLSVGKILRSKKWQKTLF